VSKADKLLRRLESRPKDFTWDEALTVLKHCGFHPVATSSKSTGSHRKFIGPDGRYLQISQPHPENILKPYQVKDLLDILRETGCIREE